MQLHITNAALYLRVMPSTLVKKKKKTNKTTVNSNSTINPEMDTGTIQNSLRQKKERQTDRRTDR